MVNELDAQPGGNADKECGGKRGVHAAKQNQRGSDTTDVRCEYIYLSGCALQSN